MTSSSRATSSSISSDTSKGGEKRTIARRSAPTIAAKRHGATATIITSSARTARPTAAATWAIARRRRQRRWPRSPAKSSRFRPARRRRFRCQRRPEDSRDYGNEAERASYGSYEKGFALRQPGCWFCFWRPWLAATRAGHAAMTSPPAPSPAQRNIRLPMGSRRDGQGQARNVRYLSI